MNSSDRRLRTPARALLLMDPHVLVEGVKLALNHGDYTTRVTQTAEEAAKAIIEWRPHLIVLNMDSSGEAVMNLLASPIKDAGGLPIVALTRRGDLRTKLTAFEAGADDILTVPFSPEEFVARILAVFNGPTVKR